MYVFWGIDRKHVFFNSGANILVSIFLKFLEYRESCAEAVVFQILVSTETNYDQKKLQSPMYHRSVRRW